MPLVRAQVRNEYGLGMPELYKDADKEDPKALLDGVAVAGLVGILRQLGDLAEFAAEVFHGLQEQVMNTSSRSNKLMVRAQNIEAAYSPLEKTLLAQRSHLHFAYTSGSHWKAHIQSEQNHFIHSDLPLFIMDSYEECRGPPRLHLLDKFDTGGPGSCLKRYSDPTFFKRASAGFEEAYAENFPRDKKARRRKKMNQKKRTWIQNGDKPQRANHGLSDRMHYASQNFDGQTSPSQTVSTYDAASKLEMEDHSNSFGSKTASGYGECVSSPIYNIKFDGCEPDEISSQLTMNISDTIDTSSLEEQRGFVDNDVEEQTGPRSSCVTWDEKTEIMEPIGPQNHSEETMEVHTNLSLDPLKGEAANIKSDYCSNESMPKSVSGANQLDDNESETDNYMDALNTIESESETDLECQTKGNLKQSLNNIATDRSIDRLNLQYMNITSSNIDSPVHVSTNVAISEENHNPISIQTNCISSEETFISKPSSVASECYAKVQSPHDTGKSLPMESLPFSDLIISDDITSPNTEAVDRNLGSLDSAKTIEQPSKPDTVLSSPSKSQKSPSVASGVTGINFWTNGVLLGLQPSKPSDFSTLGSVNHESMVPSSQSDILEGEESASKPNILRNSKLSKQDCSSKCTTSSDHDEEDIISIMKTSLRSSQAHSDRIPELTTNLHHSFSSNQSHNLLFPDSSTMVHETEKRDNPDARTFIEQFGSKSPFISPSSSPPLEHMKISFQPINGVDISKLKLKFPDGNEGHDCSVDVFSSFQLVPEESTSFQDVGSDSDGDTFCESSPHGSEDCLGHYSESDSEEWEIRESPRCNDNDIYDALWGNSAESVSTNLDVGRITQGVITNKSGIQNLFTDTVMEHSQTDLPNFDILNGSFRKELHSDSETKYQLDSDFSNEPTPPPPPLPPMEWRGMKPNPDMGIVQQVPSIQALEHDFYKKLSTSTISQQPKPAPVKHDNTEAIACTTNSKHPNGKKLNVKKDADQSLKSKLADEKEDFLQQIRTKSFSLRRTTTERPNLASSAPANVSVTAILEKANAIRQAVGSDEGEDDDSCWSED